ncbi:MAG TPA: LiaF domain-containing protein, partial [Actinomycetota bacterium]|nr:LiaF domain-containing protein [Actinomycetota bacterium]
LLGDVTENALPIGWTNESIVVLIGDVRLDLRNQPPGEGAKLRIFRLFGDVRLKVPGSSRVSVRGLTLIGDRRIEVAAGEGPSFEVSASGLIGDLEITE